MGTILIVDDTARFRKPLAAWIRLAGHRPLEAASGPEALTKAEQERPDLILLDLAMPGMDGLGFLRARWGDAVLRAIPVILLTAVTEEHYVAEARELGICDHLLKSQFSMREMMKRLELRLPAADDASPDGASPGGAGGIPSRVSPGKRRPEPKACERSER